MKLLIMMCMTLIAISSNATKIFSPPKATEKEFKLEKHNDVRVDEYYWLKERTNPEVINYLKSENNYLIKSLKPTEKLQKKLFSEMKSRIKEDESTYPSKNGPFYYYTRFEKNKQFPIYARKRNLTAKEEILFNINVLAKGHSVYQTTYEMSPNHQVAAFAYDTKGNRIYNIKFKDLRTGQFLKPEIKNVTSNLVWAADNNTLFYVKHDEKTLRSYQVYRYQLSTEKSELVYEEKNDTFNVYVYTSLAKKHIFIMSSSTLSNEARVISMLTPQAEPKLVFPREKGHEFSLTEDEEYFYILSNKDAKDYQILRTPISSPSFNNSEIWLRHRKGNYINHITVFKDYIALSTRENGLMQIEVYNKKTKTQQKIDFQDSAYSAEFDINEEYDANSVRYSYSSLRSPASIYDYEFATKKSLLKKTKDVPNYNLDLYVSERVFATARDGRKIPISILMKKNTKRDGSAPMLVYGYGSYGSSIDPWFSSNIVSLVDRGYVHAIIHVRGGGEMGRYWTDEGRTLNKKNTFFDFIDSTEFLLKEKYANPQKVFAMGGSAGGLLMGVITNLRPDLYKGIVAQVPFVDVITTMLDDTIPLTTGEYDEWGNPHEKKFYDYIKSYSPYDNVSKQAYPNILITTGLHDSQVQYWEPAKWTARLRKHNTSKNLIFLKTDLGAGHSGKSGRFDKLKDKALEYAFILEMEKKEIN